MTGGTIHTSFYWQVSSALCMCYIHPGGVEVHGAALKLCKLMPKKYALQLIKSEVCECMERNLLRLVPDCTANTVVSSK